MKIQSTLVRVGLNPETPIKEYASADLLPAEHHYDAMHGQPCVDSYTHDIGKPEHLGDFMVVRETEHKCQGKTFTVYHVAPAVVHKPSGGEIPTVLCRILHKTFCSHTPEQVWAMTPEQAKESVRQSWTTANTVAQNVMSGQLGEEWLPEGSHGGAGHMWLHEVLKASYQRDVNPLPIVRRLFPNCSWEFSRESVKTRWSSCVCEPGDVAFACEVKGGWVKAILTGERTNSPL